MRVASSGGVELVVHDLGGEGPPLVISHATGFCGAMYQVLADRLRSRWHVHAVDFRGHGDTVTPDDAAMSWDNMATDLEQVLDAIGGGPVVGFGHSMGGAVSLIVAGRRPHAFSHLFLYEPIVPPGPMMAAGPGSDNAMALGARRRRPSFPSKAEALHRYASPRSPLAVLRADALHAYVEHGMATQPDGSAALKCTPDREAQTFEGAGGHMHRALLGAIAVPTLVARGGQELHLPPGQFAAPAAAALPAGELLEFATLGHFGPLQDPLLVAQALVAFVDAH